MTQVKNCSLTRRLLHSFSSATSSSPSIVFHITVALILFIFCTLPSSVLSFKAGHVEPVPGNTVLRNTRPLLTGPSSTTTTSVSNNKNANYSNRNSNQFPPTGGGSRSAILMKLTSPRREFGGHVYEDPSLTSAGFQSPIASDLYAFSKSTESQQQLTHEEDHTQHRSPFVRFPTISSPFSSITATVQSRETHHLHQHHPPPHEYQQRQRQQQQKQKSLTNVIDNAKEHRDDDTKQGQPEQPQQKKQKPLAQSVSDLLAQREEPSSLFGNAHNDDEDEFLLDSYYTTGSDDVAGLSGQVDSDRYSSFEETSAGGGGEDDLYEKQTATPTPTVDEASSTSPSSSSPTPPHTTTNNKINNNNNNNNKSKSRSSNESNSNLSYQNDYSNENVSSAHPPLRKPTLLPLPANYLSLATFKQIDNTLEKSSSNILSRIANFWRNRTMSNRNSTSVVSNNHNSNENGTNISNNSSSSSRKAKTSDNNNYTKLANSESSNVSADFDNSIGYDEETDHDFVNDVDDDNRSGSNGNRHRSNLNRSSSNNTKSIQRQSESNKSGGGSSGNSVQPAKYISIEDLDGVSIGGGSVNSNQYVSLDDGDEDFVDGDFLGVEGEEDHDNNIMVGNSNDGGNSKEDEHTGTKARRKTETTSKQEEDNDENNLNAHFHRHHDYHSSSIEDYISSETSGAVGLEDWLGDSAGGDSAQSSHTFHDDLFHTTTGTITAVIDNSSSSGGGSSKAHHKKDLMGSGSSKIERVQKSDSDKRGVSTSLSGVTGGSASSSSIKGDIKRAESDKVWSSIDSHFGRHDLIESAESEEDNDYYYGMTIGGFLKRELWTIPLFVLASLNMILIILFEVYVLCRARGTSRRHLFLGQMLLFGLFLCSFLALMFAVHPSIVGCFVGRLGVGITYSLIFSVLMVKCVFLLSLDTGVYLPTSYQGILLFFAVAVQVAIDTQWVIMYPPFLQTVESGRSILLQCGTSFVQLLYSLSYVGFLVLVVGFLAGRAAYKGVVENYREAVYILITAVVTVPVALSWTVAGWMLQGRHQDACVSFGLVAHSLTTFLIMFMPKVGRQLASLDKEAVCFEDQEDQCSGYSPSFFHFKPTTKNYKTALWGDGNLYTTLEPTVSTINPNVFFHRNDFHSGMIY